MDESFESCFAAFDPKEQSLIEGIKKLAHENEAIKQSLVHHNEVIKKYCDDLGSLREQQIKEKEEIRQQIKALEDENKEYKERIASFHVIQAGKQHVSDISVPVKDVCNQVDSLMKLVEKMKKEESLKFPVQETHISLEEIQSHLEGICASIIDFEKRSQHVDAFILESKIAKQNQIIEDLKVELSRQMENGKKICNLENFVQEMKESNAKLESERDKYRSLSLQLQQKIEQIEFEPSVEVMQVASTQQEKVIEGLNNELIKAKDRITSLSEENGCLMQKVNTLNEICTKLNHDASQLSISEGQEISEIKNTYEMAINGLKDEIEKERKVCEQLKKVNANLSENLEEQRKMQSADLEESANMRRMIEMLKKRESKDLDKLDQVTCERDAFKNQYEMQLLLTKELNKKVEALNERSTNENLSYKGDVSSSQEDPAELVNKLEYLTRQLSSGEQTIGILSEENSNLKFALNAKIEECSCNEMSKKIDILVQENEDLQNELTKRDSLVEGKTNEEKKKVEQLQETIRQLEKEKDLMVNDFNKKHIKDGELIQSLNQELDVYEQKRKMSMEEAAQYQHAYEEFRQKNDFLEATVSKSRSDYTKLWQNYQVNIKKSNMAEQELKETKTLLEEQKKAVSNLEMRLEEGYDEIERFRQLLMDKDREIEKINGELQQIEVFKTQFEIYENDFKLEREAREKQHSDVLLLREKLHRLELENGRLRAEVDAGQRQQVRDLQRRFANEMGPSTYYQSGIYGRGGPPVSGGSSVYDGFGSGRIEAPPKDPDQTTQRACPKCHEQFPDIDSLQIHVLDCVD